MTRSAGSPPPFSSHHHDRTRTLVSWSPRHIVTPLPCRTPNEINQTTKSSPIEFTREDTSRAPLLVFFPVNPRSHYMVSGRVERGNNRRVENCGISRPTRICLWGGGSRQRAVESYIFGSQPSVQKGTSSRGGNPQDFNAQTQVSRKVEGPTVKEGVESDGR